MANEFRHVTVGTELTQAEYESITGHAFASQATGDILYASSATQLSRLPIGATGYYLSVAGGVPVWAAVSGSVENIIINGGFTVNQRVYTSGAALAAGSYGHDRWKAGAAGGDYSFTQLAGPTTITIASGKTLIQVIEDKMVYGGSYVLSWTGTAQGRYAINSATPAGSYASSPILITGQTAGTTMSVEFGAGTLGEVQLEIGTVANSFLFRPYQQELLMCKRYCRTYGGTTTYEGICLASPYNTNTVYFFMIFDEMRTTPTLTVNSLAYIGMDDGSGWVAFNALTLTGGGNKVANFTGTQAGNTWTAGLFARVLSNNSTSLRMLLTAEL